MAVCRLCQLRNGPFLRQLCCRQFSVGASRNSGKVYEFRTYAVKPSRMREAVKIVEEILPFRERFSKMNGYWFTELGGLNEMNFLWEFDSLSHRTSVRKEIAGNKEWVETLLPTLLPLLDSQTNILWKPFPWYEPQLEPVKGYGVYELVRHDMKPGLIPQFEYTARQGLPARLSHDYPKPLGMWYTEFGPTQRVFSLFPHVSFEARDKHREVIMKDPEWRETWRESMKLVNEVTVKALVPASVSPLQ